MHEHIYISPVFFNFVPCLDGFHWISLTIFIHPPNKFLCCASDAQQKLKCLGIFCLLRLQWHLLYPPRRITHWRPGYWHATRCQCCSSMYRRRPSSHRRAWIQYYRGGRYLRDLQREGVIIIAEDKARGSLSSSQLQVRFPLQSFIRQIFNFSGWMIVGLLQ